MDTLSRPRYTATVSFLNYRSFYMNRVTGVCYLYTKLIIQRKKKLIFSFHSNGKDCRIHLDIRDDAHNSLKSYS